MTDDQPPPGQPPGPYGPPPPGDHPAHPTYPAHPPYPPYPAHPAYPGYPGYPPGGAPPRRFSGVGITVGLIAGLVLFSAPGVLLGALAVHESRGSLQTATIGSLIVSGLALVAAIVLVALRGGTPVQRGSGLGLLIGFGIALSLSPVGFVVGCIGAWPPGGSA